MAYNYNLNDDDDEPLGSLIEPNTLQALAPTASEMAPAPPPMLASMPDLHPRDPELDDAWRGLELQKINEAKGSKYGLVEGLRDTLPTAAALVGDAIYNHGRGQLNVLQAGMGEVAAQQAAREKARQDAGELAVKMGARKQADPFAQALAFQRAQTASQNANTGLQRVNNTQQRWTDEGNPDSEHTQGKVKIAGQTAGSSATGRLNAEHELNPQTAGDKANIRTAETEAELEAQHGAAPVIAADAATKARLEAEAKSPTEQANKAAPTAADTRVASQLADAQSLPPGFELDNPQAWRAASADPTRRAAVDKYLTMTEQTRKSLEQMRDLRRELGASWNTWTDAEQARKLDQMALLKQAAVGGFAGIGQLGVINAGEYPRVGGTMPDGSLSMSDLYDPLLTAYNGGQTRRDTQLEQLQGTIDAYGQLQNSGLSQLGLRRAGAARAMPTGAGEAAPGAETVPAQLPSMPGRVPPISAANSTVTVTLNGVSRPYPRDAALRMKQLNPNVQVSE
jgi:hypothetical protein